MVQPVPHCNNKVWLDRNPPWTPKKKAAEPLNSRCWWLRESWGKRGRGGGQSPKAEKHFQKLIRWRSAAVMSARAAVLNLTSVGGLVYFPQLDTPVEPDDGAEGERRQHALSSSGDLLAGRYWSSLVEDFACRGPCVAGSLRSNEVV